MFHIASLPAWRYEDITSLSFAVVEMAAEAQNKRQDEQNRFSAAIAGVKMDEPKSMAKKAKIARIKTAMINAPKGLKTISRKELNKALSDG